MAKKTKRQTRLLELKEKYRDPLEAAEAIKVLKEEKSVKFDPPSKCTSVLASTLK